MFSAELSGSKQEDLLDAVEAGDEEAALRAVEDGVLEPDDVG